MAPIIRTQGLSKDYRIDGQRIRALEGVSLTLHAGEMVAVMGPSGSGKSTLLHLLGCLDRPSEGSYRFAGERIEGLSDDALTRLRRRHIGLVFQHFNLLPRASALDNVMLPLIYAGVAPRAGVERGRTALERVGLGHRQHQRAASLSGGEQQRVAIARGLVSEPELILADEPTGALDSHTGRQVLELLVALNRTGISLLIVTHDPGVAGYAPRLIRMLDGRLDGDAPTPSGYRLQAAESGRLGGA